MDRKLLLLLIATFLILLLIGSNLFTALQSLLGNANVSISPSTAYKNNDNINQFKIYKNSLYTYRFNQINEPNDIVNYTFVFNKYIPGIFTYLELNWNFSLTRIDQNINQVYYSRPDYLIAANENNVLMFRRGYNSINSSNTAELYSVSKNGVLWTYNDFEGKYTANGYKFLQTTVNAVAIPSGYLISFLSYYIGNQNLISDYEVMTITDNGFETSLTSNEIVYPYSIFPSNFNPLLLPSTMIGPFYKDTSTIEYGLVTPTYQSAITSNSKVNFYDYNINSQVSIQAKDREVEFMDQINLINNNSTSNSFVPEFLIPYSGGFLILGSLKTNTIYMSYDIWSNKGNITTIRAFSIGVELGYNYFSLSPLESNSNAYNIVPVMEMNKILIFGIPVVRINNAVYLPTLCILNLQNNLKDNLDFYDIITAASIYPVHYESMMHVFRNDPTFIEIAYQNNLANFIITSIKIIAANLAAEFNQANSTIFSIIFATIFSLPIIPIYRIWLNKNKKQLLLKKDHLYPENIQNDKNNK